MNSDLFHAIIFTFCYDFSENLHSPILTQGGGRQVELSRRFLTHIKHLLKILGLPVEQVNVESTIQIFKYFLRGSNGEKTLIEKSDVFCQYVLSGLLA